jgi:hypothetical protein
MRINLATPYADKDKVKSLGARWDATRKVWYIVDVADLTPFMAWIPDLAAASGDRPKQAAPQPGCECNALPWEDCIHTVAQR